MFYLFYITLTLFDKTNKDLEDNASRVVGIIGLVPVLYLITIALYGLVFNYDIMPNKSTMIIIIIGWMIFNSFIFYHKKRYLKIVSKYENVTIPPLHYIFTIVILIAPVIALFLFYLLMNVI